MKKIKCLLLAAVLAFTVFAGVGCSPKDEGKAPVVAKAAYRAKTLNVIDANDMTRGETLIMITMQGVTVNMTDDQIYIIDREYPGMNDTTLQMLKDDWGVTVTEYTDPWQIFSKYKGMLSGFITCNLGEPSVNVATGFAGAKKGIAVDSELTARVESELGLALIKDVRGWTEDIMTEAYLRQEGFSDMYAYEIKYNEVVFLRDYATMTGGLPFWVGIAERREKVMDNLNLKYDGFIMGYGDFTITGNENVFVQATSERGINYIAADSGRNYSVLSGFEPKEELKQVSPVKVEEYRDDTHYVTFVMSDGDNVAYGSNNFTQEAWWGSPDRGSVPISWTTAPTMNEMMPTVQDYRYRTQTPADNFVGDDWSFMFLNFYPEDALENHAKVLNDYMGKLDLNTSIILGMRSFMGTEDRIWDYYLKQPNLDGIIYFEWGGGGYDAWDGAVRWVSGKPIITCSAFSTNANVDMANVVAKVNSAAAYPDPTKTSNYTVVYCNNWGTTVSDIKAAADQFADNVEVVNMDQLVDLVNHWEVGKVK